jgi:hypothetical protein
MDHPIKARNAKILSLKNNCWHFQLDTQFYLYYVKLCQSQILIFSLEKATGGFLSAIPDRLIRPYTLITS